MRKTVRQKVQIAGVIAATMLAAAPRALEAAVVESFSYATATLNGTSGGSGWNGNWTVSTGNNADVSVINPGASPLSYAVPQGMSVNGGDRALQLGSVNSSGLFSRSLASVQNGADVYFSFLVRWTGGTLSGSKTATFYFADAIVDSTGWTNNSTTTPNIGIRANASGSSDIVARFGNGANSGYMTSSTDVAAGNTYLVVGRLYKSAAGTSNPYNRFSLWVNPSAGDAATPLGTAIASGPSSFGQVWFRTANLVTDDSIQLDEIRIGSSWGEVVPIPEPVVPAIAVLFSTLMLRQRRVVRGARV